MSMSTILTKVISRLIFLPTFVTAVAILVKGYFGAGDGFSAGVIAGTGVVIQFLAFGPRELFARYPSLRRAPLLAWSGLLLGLATAFAPVLWGDPIMTHYPRPGEEVPHLGLLAFHTAVLFDAAVFLLVFGMIVSVLGAIGNRYGSEGVDS
ncbi:MnhB domain-containing protein [Sphaerobacter thermophilus]|jgi:multicomponent Na+:H+ antiporter subunit B|uniref:Na+/H+ antiporter MnhB subunit-related protein n=1 Tax=Sphaerobacter thermophilus (strain ATCC 49802 / DSM 20745 / KCCM 41009 / NCIMB 13125 / S 6022) TaxID=479434 RepID=D1C3F1_SPHTD|nr:MnhB domain-containing protein [Sphaerobacter thermophilus]ACZ38768.1 Na+/H+ antiporter MnhB subunit-related protein [Sphaerobacter thermophilus DSM 20745]